jgi:hypothetical protein
MNVGNAYRGPGGAKLRQRVREKATEAGDKAARMVLTAFGSQSALTTLWIGEITRYDFVRHQNGEEPEFIRHHDVRQDKIVSYPQP